MPGGYRLTPEARANLEDICAFIAEDSIDAALRVLGAFERAFDQLTAMPGIGHARKDLFGPAKPVGRARGTKTVGDLVVENREPWHPANSGRWFR